MRRISQSNQPFYYTIRHYSAPPKPYNAYTLSITHQHNQYMNLGSKMWIIISVYISFISGIIFLANTGKASDIFGVIAAIPYGDKLCHALLYGFLAFLLNIAFNSIRIKGLHQGKLFGSVCVAVFSSLEEYSQHFISARSLDALDLAANLSGILIFSIFSSLTLNENKPLKEQRLY